MTPEDVLAHPPRVLSQAQREAYFRDGAILVEGLIAPDQVARLHALAEDFVERSRAVAVSDDVFDVAPGHGPDSPRLRRLKQPDEQDPRFWEFATGVIADLAADLVGPDVAYHHTKLNFKWAGQTADENAVGWHQDIQFYPHTNYSPLTIGLYLSDVGPEDGPVAYIPGSQDGPLYDLFGPDGQWTGALRADDVAALPLDTARTLTAPAGALTVHNCRTVHGSPPARAAEGRPLLLNAYASADAFPYTAHPSKSVHAGTIVRGKRARLAHHDPRPCPIPPDWSAGYTSIFAAQAGESE